MAARALQQGGRLNEGWFRLNKFSIDRNLTQAQFIAITRDLIMEYDGDYEDLVGSSVHESEQFVDIIFYALNAARKKAARDIVELLFELAYDGHYSLDTVREHMAVDRLVEDLHERPHVGYYAHLIFFSSFRVSQSGPSRLRARIHDRVDAISEENSGGNLLHHLFTAMSSGDFLGIAVPTENLHIRELSDSSSITSEDANAARGIVVAPQTVVDKYFATFLDIKSSRDHATQEWITTMPIVASPRITYIKGKILEIREQTSLCPRCLVTTLHGVSGGFDHTCGMTQENE